MHPARLDWRWRTARELEVMAVVKPECLRVTHVLQAALQQGR